MGNYLFNIDNELIIDNIKSIEYYYPQRTSEISYLSMPPTYKINFIDSYNNHGRIISYLKLPIKVNLKLIHNYNTYILYGSFMSEYNNSFSSYITISADHHVQLGDPDELIIKIIREEKLKKIL